MNYKPFDLAAAKAGAKVITRAGQPARIICYDYKYYDFYGQHPIVAILEIDGRESISKYFIDGSSIPNTTSSTDLVMAVDGQGNYIDEQPLNPHDPDGPQSKEQPDETGPMNFCGVLQQMSTTYLAKNHDYGNSFDESLDKYGLIAAIVRMSDKLNRLHTLSEQEAQVVSESLADTALDLANYAAMTCLYIKNREHHED